jgi:hypothetical protein
MTPLEKAQQKYQEYLRNYLVHKDDYEEYYLGEGADTSKYKIDIDETTCKMNHCLDVLQTLTYIFGSNVR